MTTSAIQAAINIAAYLGVNPMKITSIIPEDGSGWCWIYDLDKKKYFIDMRKGNPKELSN